MVLKSLPLGATRCNSQVPFRGRGPRLQVRGQSPCFFQFSHAEGKARVLLSPPLKRWFEPFGAIWSIKKSAAMAPKARCMTSIAPLRGAQALGPHLARPLGV